MNYLRGYQRFTYWAVFALITFIFVAFSIWLLNFVHSRTTVVDAAGSAPTATFINYSANTAEFLKPESLAAMAVYVGQNPQPKNAQVLKGMTTAEIAAYMMQHVAPGLKVDCTYCHNVQDFSLDTNADPVIGQRKVTARAHLTMTQDLNQNWLPRLAVLSPQKHPYGAQITCATCHVGVAKPVTWPAVQVALPDDYRLPLKEKDITQALVVTGRKDISLDSVQQNQYAMYHMKTSLGVGCTHCHNSRYFPGYDQPAKYFALTMLLMVQHIDQQYASVLGTQQPSCNMCHQGNVLPPGAARSAADIPAVLSSNPPKSN
mgnify:CR=1 FL=1